MNEMLMFKKKYPGAVIFSGGTENILKSESKKLTMPGEVIYTGYVEDLNRMKRTERYLEIGASTVINRLIDKGKRVIPEILIKALESINPPNFRNIVTLGGLICRRDVRNSVFAVLSILDAKIELRTQNSSRWIGISHLFNENGIVIANDEVLCRIRILLKDYTASYYREVENFHLAEGNRIIFSALINAPKENISFIKFVFSISGSEIIRDREIESELLSLSLPLNHKIISMTISHFSDRLKSKYSHLSEYQKYIILNLFRWFLLEINY
jgi:CO/xanthine dehydrogenase FAD-binding subunit